MFFTNCYTTVFTNCYNTYYYYYYYYITGFQNLTIHVLILKWYTYDFKNDSIQFHVIVQQIVVMPEGSRQLSNLMTNSSAFHNSSNTRRRIYVLLPAGFDTKLVVVLLLITFGVVGFVGNSIIYYFISKRKKTVGFLQRCSFVRNLNLYIKSLALSEILCPMISIPLFCVQMTLDVFQRHTCACK